jgi:hypothetical protein
VRRVRREAGDEHSSPPPRSCRVLLAGVMPGSTWASPMWVSRYPSPVGFQGENKSDLGTAAPTLFPRARAPNEAAGDAARLMDPDEVEEVPAVHAELPRRSLWGMWEAMSSPPSSTSST